MISCSSISAYFLYILYFSRYWTKLQTPAAEVAFKSTHRDYNAAFDYILCIVFAPLPRYYYLISLHDCP